MGREQKKFEKKKTREKAVKAKLLARRDAKTKQMRELNKEKANLDQINKLVKQRVELEMWAKQVEGKIPEDTHAKIRNNIDILKTLEKEYADELKGKTELQQKLGGEGFHTLPEMLESLQTRTADEQRAAHEESVFDETGEGAVYSDSNVSLTMNNGLGE